MYVRTNKKEKEDIYIIKRKNFILQYGRYLQNNYADMISETYNNLVQDQIVNQGLSYYDLRQYMKRFILSNYKNDRFHINECLLCNIKKTINNAGINETIISVCAPPVSLT